MKLLALLAPILLVACASVNQGTNTPEQSAQNSPRSIASDNEYPPQHGAIYENLVVKEEPISSGSNPTLVQKQVGRLTCVKAIAMPENIVVGYKCVLQKNTTNDYLPSDKLIFDSIQSMEVPFMIGANRTHYQKNAGILACRKIITRSDFSVVGYVCNL